MIALPILADAVAVAAAPMEVPPEQIIYSETGPRGAGRVHWYLWAGGHGRYESDREIAGPPVEATLKLGHEGFREIRELLRPLEARRALRCAQSISDQAMGILTWARGNQHVTLHIDFGCRPALGEDTLQRVIEANRMIRGAVGVSRLNDGAPDLDPGPGVMPEGGVRANKP